MTDQPLIKVCGMKEGANIREVEELGVDMIGFIFYPKSPRYLMEIPDYLPRTAQRVGVFVNEDKKTIEMLADRFSLDYIQLHGNESPDYCRSLKNKGLKIIKTFSINTRKDLAEVFEYKDVCEYFLFDTKCQQYGGSGNQFDWDILKFYAAQTPFFISGGINQYSAQSIKRFKHPYLAGIDINSRFETEPGKKDVQRISSFLNELQKQQ